MNWRSMATLFLGLVGLAFAFDPQHPSYAKHIATCRATRRSPEEILVDIDIHYVDVSPEAESTILMVHGWPSLWSTWSKQIEEFENDYHLIVPNLRGFGDSTHTGDVRSSGTMGDMVADLVCVLQSAGVRQAICMGHDWGSSICYEAARARRDIFIGVIGAVVPYIPSSGPFMTIKELVPRLPALAYQLFFDGNIDDAAAELDADIRRTMRATFRTVESPPPSEFLTSNTTFLGAWDGIEIPAVPFFSPEKEDYYVEEMGKQGFKSTLYFYTTENRHLSWKFAHEQGNHTIPQPVLALYPTKVMHLIDPVADWVLVQDMLKSAEFIPNLRVKLIEAAHWPHMEQPEVFNGLVRQWLDDHFPTGRPDLGVDFKHNDEL